MRNLLVIRQQILDCLRSSQIRRHAVERDTRFLEQSVPYTAPEAMPARWDEFCRSLAQCDAAGFITQEERVAIQAVLRGEPPKITHLPADWTPQQVEAAKHELHDCPDYPACTCGFPATVYRNPTGHGDWCAAYRPLMNAFRERVKKQRGQRDEP